MASGPPLEARLLGAPAFAWNGTAFEIGPKKPRALLIYLCAEARDEGVARDVLAELLWGPGKLANVRQALYELRKLPGAESWLDDDDPVSVRVACDVAEFEAACDRGADDEAAALAQGPFAAGFDVSADLPYHAWLEEVRARLAERLRAAEIAALDLLERRGRLDEALELARRLLDDDPLNETAHRAVMRLEHARGDTAAALEQFERCRETLQRELGVEPVPETLELLRAIEHGEGAAAYLARLLRRPEDTPERPSRLVGRAEAVAAVAGHLGSADALLLHGFGGIGKSAVAAEGVARWLAGEEGSERSDETGDPAPRAALWIDAGSAPPDDLIEALARPFRADADVARSDRPGEALLAVLEGAGVGALVLDDARSAYTVAKLRELTRGRLSLLVVSRQRYPAIARRPLARLERASSRELLALHAERELDPPGADALAEALGDHPFALRLAGVALRRQRFDPAALLERLAAGPQALEQLAARVPGAPPSERESVAALLEVSFDPLDDQAYEAFVAFGALHAPQASPELLAGLLRRPLDAVEEALFALTQVGLAERVATPGTDAVAYRVHDLAYGYVGDLAFWRPRSLLRASRDLLRALRDDPVAIERDLPNLLGAAERGTPEERVDLLRSLAVEGAYFLARGHSRRSAALLDRAARDAQRIGDRAAHHRLLGRLGDAYATHLGDPAAARDTYGRAFDEAHDMGDRDRAAIYAGLVAQMQAQLAAANEETNTHDTDDTDDTDDADAWLARAAELGRNADPLVRCVLADQRGFVAGVRGDMRRANEAFAEAVELAARLEPGGEVGAYEVARRRFYATLNLGETERALGRLDASLEARHEALELAERIDNPLWAAHVHLELGETHHDAEAALPGAEERAREHLERALAIYRRHDVIGYRERTERFMETHGYPVPPPETLDRSSD